MRRHKVDDAAVNLDLSANEATAFRFAKVLVEAMVSRANRKARENRDAILTTLIFQIKGKGVIHFRELCQFGNLINTLGAFHSAVDFLQADQVNVLALNHLGDAGQVEVLVPTDAD